MHMPLGLESFPQRRQSALGCSWVAVGLSLVHGCRAAQDVITIESDSQLSRIIQSHCVAVHSIMRTACRAEDDLTHKLAEIIKANKSLKAQEEAGSPQHIIREFANLLQFHITTYFDNTKPGIPVAQQRSGR